MVVGLLFRHLSGSFPSEEPGRVLAHANGNTVNLAGAEAVAALLMVGTISGILLAMLMNNGGGAWDNAKKFIETGALWRQGFGGAQGGGGGRYGRRSVQGYGGAVAACADQAAGYGYAGAGAAVSVARGRPRSVKTSGPVGPDWADIIAPGSSGP